jgi:hypothetical protein
MSPERMLLVDIIVERPDIKTRARNLLRSKARSQPKQQPKHEQRYQRPAPYPSRESIAVVHDDGTMQSYRARSNRAGGQYHADRTGMQRGFHY